MDDSINPLTTRRFTSSLSFNDTLRVIMSFQDNRHTVTLSESNDGRLQFHIDYVESLNRLGEVIGLIHADDDGGSYIEYTSEVSLEPYTYPLSNFTWIISLIGIIWLVSGFSAFMTGNSASAWTFVLSLIALVILNRVDNETSPDYETKKREQQYLIQRLNTAFEEAEAQYGDNRGTQKQIAG